MTVQKNDHSNFASRVQFRAVVENDFDALVQLRISAMRESLERVGRFDPERARERLRASFHPEHTRFIELDGEKIGFFSIRPVAQILQLDHLYVLPSHQSLGIGSYVMGKLIGTAIEQQKAIHVGALKDSAAQRFYRRHNFKPTHETEWDVYYVRAAESD